MRGDLNREAKCESKCESDRKECAWGFYTAVRQRKKFETSFSLNIMEVPCPHIANQIMFLFFIRRSD